MLVLKGAKNYSTLRQLTLIIPFPDAAEISLRRSVSRCLISDQPISSQNLLPQCQYCLPEASTSTSEAMCRSCFRRAQLPTWAERWQGALWVKEGTPC